MLINFFPNSVFAFALLSVAILLNGCTLNARIENLGTTSSVFLQKIYFDTTELDVSEGSAAYVSIQMTEKLDIDTEVSLTIVGDSSILLPIPATIKIAAGMLSAPLKIQTIDDSVYKGPLVLHLILSTLDSSVLTEPNTLQIKIADNDLPLANFTLSSQSVSEGASTATVIVQLDATASSPVTIPFILSGTAVLGAGDDYTISASSVTIPAGQSTVVAIIAINNDLIVESNETVVITMGTPTNATLGSISSHTLTIGDNDLGAFAITGVTGASDSVQNAVLNGGTVPTLNWGASVAATSYDVTIYASDGITVSCATQNSIATNYSFTGCALTLGLFYRASVVAKSASLSLAASNSSYSFFVNQNPVAGNDGPIRIMKGSGTNTYAVLTTDATKGLVGDSDPDVGDTLSIIAITQGSAGGVVTNPSSTTVTYTPPTASFTGIDTFTYTIDDGHGTAEVGTVTMHVMSTYTWTGKVSANWTTDGNWCGTLTNNACVGTTGFPNSSATSTHVAVFDATCTATGHSCTANIGGAVQAYGLNLDTGYTGTLTQLAGAGNTVSLGVGGYKQSAGTFMGGNANVTITGGTYVQSLGTSQWGTATLYLDLTQGYSLTTMTVGATANMGFLTGGTFRVSGKGNCGGIVYTLDLNATQTFENVIIDGNTSGCGASGLALASGDIMTVNGGFSHNIDITLNTGRYKIYGNINVSNAGGADSAELEMLGAVNSTYEFNGVGVAAKLIVSKTTGFKVSPKAGTTSLRITALDVKSGEFEFPTGTLEIRGQTQGPTVLKIDPGTTTTIPLNSTTTIGIAGGCGSPLYYLDVDSTITFQNLNFYGYMTGCGAGNLTFGAGDIINVAKTLNLSTSGAWQLQSTIYLQGDLLSGSYSGWGGVLLNGVGAQNITQYGSSTMPSISINKAGGSTTLLSAVTVNGADADFNLTNGTLNLNGFALVVSDGISNNNILTFSAGTTVNRGGTGTFSGEQTFTAGATINP